MKKFVIVVFVIVTSFSLFGQNKGVKLLAEDAKLSEILVQLRDDHAILLSFNHQFLSQYRVSVDSTFISSSDALEFLISDFPINIIVQDGVFILVREEPQKIEYILNVQVNDKTNGESLPFSNVLVNSKSLTTNQTGRFSAKSIDSEIFDLKISYMGYYILDTMLYAGNHLIEMQPATINLKEILIEGKTIDEFSINGIEAGNIRLNKITANHLPGNGDNSVFNLLRLQPGILASGEQTGDMVIWGSYEGQSKFVYNGFTVFGLKNFKENISTVNPFAVKDIQVFKAAYGSELEGRVGGIVKLVGANGRIDKPELKVNLNNQTANALVSFPILKKSALSVSYRKAYKPLFSTDAVSVERQFGNRKTRQIRTDFTIMPEYDYQDFNLVWSGTMGSDEFNISMFKGLDEFDYSLKNNIGQNSINLTSEENNDQEGVSFTYNKNWGTGGQTKIQLSKSELVSSSLDEQKINQRINGQSLFDQNIETQSSVLEDKLEVSHQGYWKLSNSWKSGIQYIKNQTSRYENSLSDGINNTSGTLDRFGYFLQSEMALKNWKLRAGGRADYLNDINKVYLQPRFSLAYGQIDNIRFSLSWGIYNQFLSKNAIIDARGNIQYIWNVTDNENVPTLGSKHTVVGLSGYGKGFNWKVEYFNKNTEGLTRVINTSQLNGTFNGESRSNGLDFFISKEIGGHHFWVSYTLSSIQEHFEYFTSESYRRALHDQQHEIKAVALLDLDPFYFSADYVFGSGFPDPRPFRVTEPEETNYSRFDISARVKLRPSKPYIESGVSILNFFNTENIKYNNFLRIPQGDLSNINIHTEALPFTPTLFFKLVF